jgi:hypothetical protein
MIAVLQLIKSTENVSTKINGDTNANNLAYTIPEGNNNR